jgi:hypothetical protein
MSYVNKRDTNQNIINSPIDLEFDGAPTVPFFFFFVDFIGGKSNIGMRCGRSEETNHPRSIRDHGLHVRIPLCAAAERWDRPLPSISSMSES